MPLHDAARNEDAEELVPLCDMLAEAHAHPGFGDKEESAADDVFDHMHDALLQLLRGDDRARDPDAATAGNVDSVAEAADTDDALAGVVDDQDDSLPPDPPAAAADGARVGRQRPRRSGAAPPTVASRTATDITVVIPGGHITYYHTIHSFQATCNNQSHGRCALRRQATADGRGGTNQAAGRPLGYLAAWLAMGARCDSKDMHWDPLNQPSLTDRSHARAGLALQPAGLAILGKERPMREGETEEPIASA